MEIVINDGSGDNHWSRGWADRFADAIPADTLPVSVELNVSGRSQIMLKVRHDGLSTLCTLNSDRTADPEHRARQYGEWFSSAAQQALFEQVRERETGPILVERAAVLAAALKVDGDRFARGVRDAVSTGVAHFKGGKPAIRIGMASVSLAAGLTIRYDGGTPTVRLRTRDFRVTHLTFTPQMDMHLPRAIMESMPSHPLDRFVDHPVIVGLGLVVADVTCAGGGSTSSRPRTSIHLASDTIPLDEAVALIEERRPQPEPE